MKKLHCKKCQRRTEFHHLHDLAQGVEGTHMSGTERYICQTCNSTYYVNDTDDKEFVFIFDKKGA